MPPLRGEASTVSLPPREKIAGKRRARAIKSGHVLSHPSITSAKRPSKVPAPTLASTRKRRAAADVAYLDRPDGYHIKRVVRRPATPEPQPVPYLAGQDDIPRSDEESDDDTAATVLEIFLPTEQPAISIDAHAQAVPAQPEQDMAYDAEYMDYDAEGEDDDAEGEDEDEIMQDHTGSSSLAGRTFNSGWERPQSEPIDLIGDASEEDMRALFGGLDSLPADLSTDSPDNFPSNLRTGFGPMAANGFANIGHSPAPALQGPGSFAMHQLHAAVDDLEVHGSLRQDSHGSGLLAAPVDHSAAELQLPSTRPSPFATPIVRPRTLPAPFARLSPLSRHTTQIAPASPAGTPINLSGPSHALPARRAPHLSTRNLVAQARSQPRTHSLPVPQPSISTLDRPGRALSPPPPGFLLRRPPLRKSLDLPGFLQNNEADGSSSDREQQSDHDQSPSTPVALDDTDINLDENSPVPVTQARSRAVRYFNVRVLPRHASLLDFSRIPTNLHLQINASNIFKLYHRRNRNRQATATGSPRNRNILCSGAFTSDQRAVVSHMEYHVLKDIIWVNPWPELEGREGYLLDAERYATRLTGVSGNDVFTPKFLDTIYYRMSANRGNSLAKIEYMMEQEFGVAAGDKRSLYQLMDKDLFLFPNVDRDPSEYFCVGALSSALEIILFKSSKPIGLAFMEELCQPDDTEKCMHWHRKLRDQRARKGVPPGLLAFAATQMYWALEKLYLGSKVNFDEQHYRGVWNRYFRALVKLPHLGRLRIDTLDKLKEYYMAHWPAEEPDEDDESSPAW